MLYSFLAFIFQSGIDHQPVLVLSSDFFCLGERFILQ